MLKRVLISLLMVCSFFLTSFSQNAELFEQQTNDLDSTKFLTEAQMKEYYTFFDTCSLFIWGDVDNNCEDRANGISMLLEAWDIPHYKIWIFNQPFLEMGSSKLCGDCKNKDACWGFHVATVIPYVENGEYKISVIDPATLDQPATDVEWAENITCSGTNYYMFTDGDKYMYSQSGKKFAKDTFWGRGKKNTKWTYEGLAGINGKDFWQAIGKPFKKKKIKWVKSELARLKSDNPLI
jgi:hypothetical protein